MPDYTPPRRIPPKRDKTKTPDVPTEPVTEPLLEPSETTEPIPEKPKKRTAKEREQDRIRQDLYALLKLDQMMGEADEAVHSLKSFLKISWPIVAPGTDFQDNWHIDCICLPGHSLVTTESGQRRIDSLSDYKGKILSWNHAAQKSEWRAMTAWMQSRGKPLVRISTPSHIISLTSNHPVFTMERGYVQASEVRVGETLRIVQAVRKEVRQSALETREVLQSEMLWGQQDPAEEILHGLREAVVLEREETLREMPGPAYGRNETERHQYAVSSMQQTAVPLESELERNSADIRCVLQSHLLRSVRTWSSESGVLQRTHANTISAEVQICEEEGATTGRQHMLSVLEARGISGTKASLLQSGHPSHRPEPEEQRRLESGSVMSDLSPEAGEPGCRTEIVDSVETSLPAPAVVYNIEVDGNHNYFAEGVLVHNCEHIEALMRREIRRLIINIPPRMLKSHIISVVLPAWRWLKEPAEKFLAASYGRQLALRDSRRCRNLIASKWYQDRWASAFKLAADQNEKGRFENDKGGFRIIASVEGGVLGEGGSCALYDDPNDLARMVSEPETYPQSVREWYSGTASSRNIDPRSDVRLCIQQRASYGGDLTEYLLELGGWDQLVIPNEYDGRRTVGPLSFPDPRTHHGQLLFPERLGPEETDILKREQKTHYSGQYNQKPSVIGRSGLKREWFNFWVPKGALITDDSGKVRPIRISLADGTFVERTPVELPTAFEQIVHSLDCAFKGNEDNDFVADHVWGRIGANTFLLHREHGHWNFPETLAAVRRVSNLFPSPEKLVEDKANGPAVVQTLRNEIPGLIAVNPEGGKWSRVAAISGYVEAGNVYLPSPDLHPYIWDLLSEFAAGQSAKHDDDTDAMSQALKRLYDAQAQSGLPEFRVQPLTGEPTTACHVADVSIPADWRRFIAVIPNRAALWFAESPTGSGALRIYRELDIERLDAGTVGRQISELTLPDLLLTDSIRPIINSFSRSFDIFLPKPAFSVIESVGSWAELMEASILAWEPPTGEWEERKFNREIIKSARFRSELVEEEVETSLDRLRELLAFQPPEWTTRKYDRKLALALAEKDLNEYHDYMSQVEGKVRGEWPKLKFSSACPQLIAQMGTVRRDKLDELPAFVECLLLGVSAPARMARREVIDRPYVVGGGNSLRNKGLLARKFAMR